MTNKKALKLKPANIGSTLKEFQIPPPRPMVWYNSDGSKITYERELKLFVYGIATQAWLTSYRMESDNEGPDFFLEYCFETVKGLHFGNQQISYDSFHMYLSDGGAYDHWCRHTVKDNRYFTLIYNEENPDDHMMYIECEYRLGKPYDIIK
jgi:hypothetical protein